MIKIHREMDTITISGHANYSDSNDIVCASVSSVMYTTVNAIFNLNKDAITFVDDGKECNIIINKKDKVTESLVDNMMLMFEELHKQYPSNIKIN
jgi:uncharacterized protein YsxB (DUF464 family)